MERLVRNLGLLVVISAIWVASIQAALVIPQSSKRMFPLNLIVLLLCCALFKAGIGMMKVQPYPR